MVNFFCRNCMNLYRTENALKKHERLCTNHDYCETIMPTPNKNILEFKSNEKSLHIPHIIYADLEVILKKINHVNLIHKTLIQKRKMSILLVVMHYT